MNDIQPSIAIELNKLHELAIGTARQAVDHAKQAGELLLQVKAQLPHGEFGRWCENNTALSERTCQRYMAVALGKEVPIRALAGKPDTVSVLTNDASVDAAMASQVSDEDFVKTLMDLHSPSWMPELGHWYIGQTNHGVYWIVPDLLAPSLFHVSRFYDSVEQDKGDGDLFDGTRCPIEASRVEFQLKRFQLPDPSMVEWKIQKKKGLNEPFGAPENYCKFRVLGNDGKETWLRHAS
jgi:hypothetical protein